MPRGIYIRTEEHKKKIGKSNKGKVRSEKSKRNMSEKMKGNKNSFGNVPSKKTRQKISKALKGKYRPEKTKQKISEGLIEYHKNNPIIEKQREKISSSTSIAMYRPKVQLKLRRERQPLSDDHKDKISKALKGKIPKNLSLINANKFGKNNPFYEGHHSQEWKQQHSDKLIGKMPKNIQRAGIWGNVKRGTYNINGKEMFFRSKWEVNYALYLDFLVKQKQIKSWLYENKVFIFDKIKFGTRSYRPDFEVINNDGSITYHEVKGYMIPQSKTQMRRFKKYYPEEFSKLRFVIYDPFSRSKENGKMVNFFLEDLKISFDRLISYKEIRNKLGTLIPGWE